MSQLASRFSRNSRSLYSREALSDDQIRAVAPSIFATQAHASRSERYSYIPTIDVLNALRKEGFRPFMVAQSRTRIEGKQEHTKHMMRLRHADQINGTEANEIVLLNSHDGSSSYQMLAGQFRYVCKNGMVCGDVASDVRVPHKGDVIGEVVSGAFDVLDGFTRIVEEREGMKAVTLDQGEQVAFARAALALKYEPHQHVPVKADQLIEARRFEDRGADLWTSFQRVQENLTRGGLEGRAASGRRMRTREVGSIDENVRLNRALWVLADEMRKLRG